MVTLPVRAVALAATHDKTNQFVYIKIEGIRRTPFIA